MVNNLERLTSMLNLQEELNIVTNGSEYRSAKTLNGDDISWTRCIVMETFALANNTKWKHWRDVNRDVDWDEIRVEIVDIYHFLLSYLMKYSNIDEVAKRVLDYVDYDKKPLASELLVRDEAEKLIYYTIMVQNNGEIGYDEASKVLLGKFFTICKYASISFEELYQLYVAKNRLNLLRQNSGYKDGTYSKSWGDRSDVDAMFTLLTNMGTQIDSTDFYDKLDDYYKTKA